MCVCTIFVLTVFYVDKSTWQAPQGPCRAISILDVSIILPECHYITSLITYHLSMR